MSIPVFFPIDGIGGWHFSRDSRPLCGAELLAGLWGTGMVASIVNDALCSDCAILRSQYPELQDEPEVETLRGVYIFNLWKTDYYKIGVSKDTMQRLASLQQGNPIPIVYVWESRACSSRRAYYIEHKIHDLYRHSRLSGSQGREWFRLTELDVQRIQGIINSDLAAD